ncbi:uncharacterized protein AMSG_12316 [Thecamonas trahens ATCC 50062]|uniref:Uncharacterized protein n=1 Tax=Thecamonas trahens ATCC 50062 TaxID=461836 RepID=A0A0L0DQG3_THETB|nr:hypothetical protein AMSG_12316 [Thecamonas trahens ATCC 50062]KNC54266.1 hypothetical protein AMSG_12316 [Thecamonas trahens ATCC 50062]|eukprot:XP_013753920.1 hypothetical protein AMSG_12316 [Thecamonas trahens ATCC 50062]
MEGEDHHRAGGTTGGYADVEMGSVPGLGPASSSSLTEAKMTFDALAAELDTLLLALKETVANMGNIISASKLTPPPARVHTLHRDREMLRDFEVEFRKTRDHVNNYLARIQLLDSMDEGIAAYKSEQEHVLREARAINATDRMTDALLGSAAASRAELLRETGQFRSINSRLADMSARFPLIGNIMSKIKSRKRRDMYILASVIAFCIIVIAMYWWNKASSPHSVTSHVSHASAVTAASAAELQVASSDLSHLLVLFDSQQAELAKARRQAAELAEKNAALEAQLVDALQFQVDLSRAYKDAVAELDALKQRSPASLPTVTSPAATASPTAASPASLHSLTADLARTTSERDSLAAELARTSDELHALRLWAESYQYGEPAESKQPEPDAPEETDGLGLQRSHSWEVPPPRERFELLVREKSALEEKVDALELELAHSSKRNTELAESLARAETAALALENRDLNRSAELERAAAEVIEVDREYGEHFAQLDATNTALAAEVESLRDDKIRLEAHIAHLTEHMHALTQLNADLEAASRAGPDGEPLDPASFDSAVVQSSNARAALELHSLREELARVSAAEAREKKRVRQLRAKLRQYVARVEGLDRVDHLTAATAAARRSASPSVEASLELALLADEMDMHAHDAATQLQAAADDRDAAERAATAAAARAATSAAVADARESGLTRQLERSRTANAELQSRLHLLLAQIAELEAMNDDLASRLAVAEAREGAALESARDIAGQGAVGAATLLDKYNAAISERDAASAALEASREEVAQLHTRLAAAAELKSALKSTFLVEIQKRTAAFKQLRSQLIAASRRSKSSHT